MAAGSAGGLTAGAAGAGAAAGGGSLWQQFQSMYGGGAGGMGGGPSGQTQGAAMGGLGALLSGKGDAMRRLSATFRGPTMPLMPHLNTSQVGPNLNPGQMGLSQLLATIATRRG
jgi:hypothetical protein